MLKCDVCGNQEHQACRGYLREFEGPHSCYGCAELRNTPKNQVRMFACHYFLDRSYYPFCLVTLPGSPFIRTHHHRTKMEMYAPEKANRHFRGVWRKRNFRQICCIWIYRRTTEKWLVSFTNVKCVVILTYIFYTTGEELTEN